MRIRWILPVLALFCVACQSQPATEVPVVVVSTAPFVEPTATPDCQHADGVRMDVERVSDKSVTLHISGLQPGEVPYITYSTFTRSASRMMSLGYSVAGADANGKFTSDSPGLVPIEGETSATWDIRLIHSRGVECATITLP